MRRKLPVACSQLPIAILILSFLAVAFSTPTAPDEQLVEVTSDNVPGVVLEMRYATERNITGKAIYPNGKAWLRMEAICKLAKVARNLEEKGYRLVIWDAWRPSYAQKALWASKPDGRFLTPPNKTSRHARGTSVDLSLGDKNGKILEMPSDHDEFNAKADEDFSDVPKEAGKRARVLRSAMFAAGFSGVPDEWWHYDLKDWADYEPIRGDKTDKDED